MFIYTKNLYFIYSFILFLGFFSYIIPSLHLIHFFFIFSAHTNFILPLYIRFFFFSDLNKECLRRSSISPVLGYLQSGLPVFCSVKTVLLLDIDFFVISLFPYAFSGVLCFFVTVHHSHSSSCFCLPELINPPLLSWLSFYFFLAAFSVSPFISIHLLCSLIHYEMFSSPL